MATRKELGVKLMEEMQQLADDIHSHHQSYTGTTYIGESSMDSVNHACAEFLERLTTIKQSTAEEYLALAPEMRSQLNHDVWQLESVISDFKSSVRSVHFDTQSRDRELNDPLRPTGGRFARRTGSNELTTVHDSVVQVVQHVPSGLLGLGSTPIVTGHAHQKVVRTFDNRGRQTGVSIYDRDMFGNRYPA